MIGWFHLILLLHTFSYCLTWLFFRFLLICVLFWWQFFFLAATISAPPTTNIPGGSSSNSDGNKIATINTTGAASKIIHPSEDISLEEIRARHSKYARHIPSKPDDGASSSSNAASEVCTVRIMNNNKNNI